MKRPIEANYISYVAYTRALEDYCDSLEQPQQEPAFWFDPSDFAVLRSSVFDTVPQSQSRGWKPLYTSPPQRTWVALTHGEYYECARKADAEAERKHIQQWSLMYLRAIEAKLKEKNT